MNQNNLIHPYKTEANFYIYDANSNEILRTNKTVYDYFTKGCTEPGLERALRKLRFPRANRFEAFYPITNLEEKLNELHQLILNITEKCNLQCDYCIYSGSYLNERVHSSRQLPIKKSLQIVDYFLNHSKKVARRAITFYGGEPLLNFSLIKNIVEYAKERNEEVICGISTNGTLINFVSDFLYENNFIVWVSIDGPKDIHDKHRIFLTKKGSYSTVIKNLSIIKKTKPKYYRTNINFLVTISEPQAIKEVKEFFSENELFVGHLLKVSFVDQFEKKTEDSNYERLATNELSDLKKEYVYKALKNEHNPFLDALFSSSFLDIHKRDVGYTKRCWPNKICIPGTQRLFCDTDGSLYPCEKVRKAFKLGKGKIEIKRVKELIQQYINISKKCLECWAARLCFQCFVTARKGLNLSKKRKESLCEIIKKEIHENLVSYCKIMESNPRFFDDGIQNYKRNWEDV